MADTRQGITVLTASIPGRESMLGEAVASVHAQTMPVVEQLVWTGAPGNPPPQRDLAVCRNRLLSLVETDWVATLADDNLWLAHHVATIVPALEGADVIYTWEANGHLPREDCSEWSQEQLIATFDVRNFIDGDAAVIRTDLLRTVGGWSTEWVDDGGGHFAGSPALYEDHDLWRKLALAGARFRCLPVDTWRYRVGDWSTILRP